MLSADAAAQDWERLKRKVVQMERGEALSIEKGLVVEPGPAGAVCPRGVALGHALIDARFQGGVLPFGVHEAAALSMEADGGAARLAPTQAVGFSLMIMARVLAARPEGRGLIVQPAGPEGENGALYGPGLAALGLSPDRVALVRVRNGAEALRVVDEALRSGAAAAVAAEIWADERLDLSLTRRFNMSAQLHDVMAVLVTRQQSGTSAAMTRWTVGAATSSAEIARARRRGLRRPCLGRPALDLALTRNRRGAEGGWPLGQWTVEWDGETRLFRAPEALSAPVAGAAFHRPDAAVA